MNSGRRWGPLRSLLALAPVLIGVPWYSLSLHNGVFEQLAWLFVVDLFDSQLSPSHWLICAHPFPCSSQLTDPTDETHQNESGNFFASDLRVTNFRLCEISIRGHRIPDGRHAGACTRRYLDAGESTIDERRMPTSRAGKWPETGV
jgi:hypothetical protein